MLATPEIIAAAAQRGRLEQVLPRYLRDVPLYRERPLPGTGILDTAEGWRKLPLITKHDIRRGFPSNFLGPGRDLEQLVDDEILELEHTSGTSEERTPLLLPKGWWAEQERRALELNPAVAACFQAEAVPRRVTITSPVCSGDICYTGVPARSDRIVENALHLSLSKLPFLWSAGELDRMTAEACDWAPLFLDVDPVYGVVFALHCERRGLRLPSLRFVLCSYEFLSLAHRRILERVFKVPVFNLYGSTETGHLLMQEEARGQMRPSLQTAFLELIEPDAAGIGELVVTTLTNDFMPLVRYRIGDLVQAHETGYGMRYTLHGRALDAFRIAGNRRVTTLQIDRCFDLVPGVAHYQLLQRGQGPWLLRYVPDPGAESPCDPQRLREVLCELLSPGQPMELQACDILMPEHSGKFRLGYPQTSLSGV